MRLRRRRGNVLATLAVVIATAIGLGSASGSIHARDSTIRLERLKQRDDSSTNGWALATNMSNGLGDTKIQLIESLLNRTATLSWEVGAHMEALLELEYPTLSVFDQDSIPPGEGDSSSTIAYPVLSLANSIFKNHPTNSDSFMSDGSAGDPASVGVGVLLANWTGAEVGINETAMGAIAAEEIRFLLEETPRTADGAISHRTDEIALWADFVYQVPPYLAYYGVLTNNATIIQAAYDQCRLYRNYLRSNESNGLWIHIVYGSNPDPGLWATGNAWAAAGMIRTLATLKHSVWQSQFSAQIADLGKWAKEIVVAAFDLQNSDDLLFPNYFNSTNSTMFSDCSGVALLSACAFRLASPTLNLNANSGLISNATLLKADAARRTLYNHVDSSSGALSPVVDPNSYTQELFNINGNGGNVSPEGQAFVLMMEAAWKDWGGADSLVSQENNSTTGGSNKQSGAVRGSKLEGGLVAAGLLVALILGGGLSLFL